MSWKYILFDLDGTLTDSQEGILNCVKYALEDCKREIPPHEELLQFIGPPLIEGFQKITGMSYEEARKATEKYRERYNTVGLFENAVYAGIENMLADLKKQGKTLAVATSKPEPTSLRILEHFHLTSYFDVITGSSLDGRISKKTDVIIETLSRLNIDEEKKKDLIMVGDRKYDILGAKACGLTSLGVYYGFAPKNELEENGADYIVNTVSELWDILK